MTSDGRVTPIPFLDGDLLHPGERLTSLREPADEPVPGVLGADARLALLDALPNAVFVMDPVGTVLYVNLRMAEMIGRPRPELIGSCVLDHIDVADLDFAAEMFNARADFGVRVLGPARIRYVDAAGSSHWTQVWSQLAPAELGIEGYVVSLTTESVRDVLASAVESIAVDDQLGRTLGLVADSMQALPMFGAAAVLVVQPPAADGPGRFRAIGEWPVSATAIDAFGTPWRRVLADGVICDVDDTAEDAEGCLPDAIRADIEAAGVRAVWSRPIHDHAGDVVAVLVVFRPFAGAATPNQQDHLRDATRLAALAFAQARRRLELRDAAHRDALTGTLNRAALNERLANDRRSADVLFVDLDHFKSVNDTFGHEVGDLVLEEVGARISGAVRRCDLVYRAGGDEFVVLCEPQGTDVATRTELAQRIVDQVMAPFDVADRRIRIGATVGIAAAAGRDLDETLRAADRALYLGKERGRSTWVHDHHAGPAPSAAPETPALPSFPAPVVP